MTNTIRYPASFAQRSMFLQNATHPSDNSFDLAFAYRIEGEVDFGRLRRVLASIISATPGICTHFNNEPDGLVAIVQDESATLETLEVPPAAGVEGTAHEDAWVVAETQSALDAGPISPTASVQMRMRLYTGKEATYFTLICGHIVGDAYSFYRVMGAIGALYGSKETQWPAILAGLVDHPGTVPPTAVTDGAKASYLELLTGIESFEHAGLVSPRIDGSILGIERSILIAGDAAERIRASDAIHEFGAATVFFAAYASTLQRLSGEATVTLGVPVAGRSGHRTKNAIGFFVNTLPLPVHIDRDQTWWELCQQVKSGLRVLQANQGVDLAGADSALVSGGASFRGVDNAITLYKQGLVLQLKGCEISSLPLQRTALPYPLSVTVADHQQGYDVVVKCADHLIEALPEDLLMEAIMAITTQPSTRVVGRDVFVADPGPPLDPTAGTGMTVLNAIEQAARNNPSAIALRSVTQTMSYGELVARANEFACSLESSAASEYVVVQLPKSCEAVIAMLGVMSAGRVYVPVDPDSPSARTELILSQLEAHLGGSPTVIDAGSMNELVSAGTTPRPAVRRPGGGDAAYVIFTSGSTGEPKGVVIPHSNLVALLDSTVADFGFGPADTWCAFHSLAFDFSIWEVFGALASGASVVIPTADEVRNPEAFVKLLQRERVSVLNQTPSAFRRLSEVATLESGALDSVRMVVFGGEALYPSDLRTWVARVGTQARFINMYGITETTVHVTAYELSAEDIDFEHRSPIGRPLRHLRGLVIDRFGRECPVGVPGELLVTGSSLARGYLGRPDLTGMRFRTIESNGERLTAYTTGDKVYQQASGELVYIGRLDDQVQLRGYRIELGEIESAFSSCEDAAASVVRLVDRDGTEPYLVAWVAVANREGTHGERGGDERFSWSDEAPYQEQPGAARRTRAFIRRIRRSLATRLPHYMMPSVIVPVHRIPTTINGKPDVPQLLVLEENHRRATTTQKETDGRTSSSLRPDRSPIEKLADHIASVWASTIGTGNVGVEDRFMDVGGTSMHVMQVHSRLRTQLGLIDLELIDLFEHATPLALATHLSKRPSLADVSAYQGEFV